MPSHDEPRSNRSGALRCLSCEKGSRGGREPLFRLERLTERGDIRRSPVPDPTIDFPVGSDASTRVAMPSAPNKRPRRSEPGAAPIETRLGPPTKGMDRLIGCHSNRILIIATRHLPRRIDLATERVAIDPGALGEFALMLLPAPVLCGLSQRGAQGESRLSFGRWA